ncbi:MAG: polysaccharide biosynthesis/export family protein [Flavobacteriales bacterium]|nr:polysaccharide biosynthesis/export family protein [Flavobacteriales bacterium]
MTGCVPFRKSVLIYEGKEKFDEKVASYKYINTIYRLQPFDIVDITFNEKDPTIRQILESTPTNTNYFNTPSGLYVNGFRVNEDGTLDIFNIGTIKAAGLTIDELQKIVHEKLREKYPYAEVGVKLVSFKISVLGEVNNPGLHYVFNERFNLLDALALAGGTSEYANTQRIKIVRKIGEEQKIFKLDLSQEKIFDAENFYVWPHDVIYVEPLKSKPVNTTFKQITPILSVISVLATVVNITALIIYRN